MVLHPSSSCHPQQWHLATPVGPDLLLGSLAFVDIGVHQDGLVHISQITNKKFIKHPLEVVSVGDIVEVKVLSVDVERKRIQLSMIL